MTAFYKKLIDFFLFSSLFLALIAVLLCMQTLQFAGIDWRSKQSFLLFIFSASLSSYNFHWMLTPPLLADNHRNKWSVEFNIMHWALFLTGAAGILYWSAAIISHWPWMLVAALLTFIYSAPKIPFTLFSGLKKYTFGKTIFLAQVWMLVTTLIPLVVTDHHWSIYSIMFCCSRFFLIYAICILFDYRDREADKKEGIRNMLTQFSEKGVNRLFYSAIVVYVACIGALWPYQTGYFLLAQLLPAVLLFLIYPLAKRNFSPYLYYFVLDGLLLISPLLTVFLPI